MNFSIATRTIAASALLMGAGASFSHVTLQDPVSAAGAGYRAALRVGHGCEGAPTTEIRVAIPADFHGAQPMPKPGWTLSTQHTEGVLEIRWRAHGPESALPDAFYDEFVFRGTTPTKPGPLWFKVLQTCERGSNAWIEVPAAGASTKGLKAPAPLLEVLDVRADGGHSH